MPDYSKGKIYKLVSYQTDDVYYGSTINPLSKRLSNHKCKYKAWINIDSNYVTSFELVKYDDVKIILVEEYECNNKQQLQRKEREYIEQNDCVNKRVPTRERACEHKKRRERCIECNGSAMCEHKKRRERCITCDGSAVCIHKKIRAYCTECNGSATCEHKKRKSQCKDCNGKSTQQVNCPLCDKSMRRDKLTRHINTVHEDCDFFNKSKTIYEFATDSEDEVIE